MFRTERDSGAGMGSEKNTGNFHKEFFKNLPNEIPQKVIEESIKRVRDKQKLIESVIGKGQYSVLLLGPNENEGAPSKEILTLQGAIQKEGFPCCTIGSQYYETAGRELSEADTRKDMLDNSDLIILVDSTRPGVVTESMAIINNAEWKRKTIFFFKYSDYDALVDIARAKKYPIQFKFPIPYKEFEELKAKVLFGVHHCYMYISRKAGLESTKKRETI